MWCAYMWAAFGASGCAPVLVRRRTAASAAAIAETAFHRATHAAHTGHPALAIRRRYTLTASPRPPRRLHQRHRYPCSIFGGFIRFCFLP